MHTLVKIIALLLIIAIAAGYYYTAKISKDIAEREKFIALATAHALSSPTTVRRFVDVFPDSRHGVHLHPARWQARVLIHGRYDLLAIFLIQTPSRGSTELKFGQPALTLSELIQLDADGIGFGVDKTWPLADDAWPRLMNANGDLSVLAIDVVRDKPYPSGDLYWSTILGGVKHTVP